MAIRLDRGRLGKAKPNSNGAMRIPAALTSVGIFEYKDANGKITRELKAPEEVFRPETLDSLRTIAVTDLHPTEFVNPSNYKRLSVGVVGENVTKKGDRVEADLVIQDANMIAKIDVGDRQEVSLGFTCDIDPTPGVFRGQHYDAVQRNIIHNHAAIGPSGWGRCGKDVALRVDGQEDIQASSSESFDDKDTAPAVPPKKVDKAEAKRKIHMIRYSDCGTKVTIDGVEYSLKGDAAQATQALISAHDRLRAGRKTDASAESVSLEDKCCAAEATALAFAVKNANPSIPAFPQDKLDSVISETMRVLDQARAIAPKAEFKVYAPREIMVTALVARGVEAKKLDGKSLDYVTGLFDSTDPEEQKEEEEKKSTFAKAADAADRKVVDSNEPKSFTAAEYQAYQQKKLDEKNSNAAVLPFNRSQVR